MNAQTTARMLAAEVLAVILPDACTGDERTRRATPILDPTSREIVGYEMEAVSARA